MKMKIYIDTLGCMKNFNDSEMAAGILEEAGFVVCERPEHADALMVNTCGFIDDAKKESISRIFELAEIKGKRPLIVSGCLSQRYIKELFREMPEVDLFLGVNEYGRLPEILKDFSEKRERDASFRDQRVENTYDGFENARKRKLPENTYSASLKIAEGCNNRCAYCVIPKIRGPFRSREEEDILAEAGELSARGVKELILIAQDVSAYGMDIYGEYRLAALLRKLCKIEGIRWIRLMYCYEDRITDELIDTIASEPKICKYIDIPIQHASDAILKAMRRRSSRAGIEDTLRRLRERVPGIHIRTTLITGFPGETAEDFAELLDFVKKERFERLGVFAYSREEGTEAASMKKQLRSDVKERRKDRIMREQAEISLSRNREKIGKILDVLVEERDSDAPGLFEGGRELKTYIGRSEYDAPEIDGSVIFTSERELGPGDFVRVRIDDAFDYDLTGRELSEKDGFR